MKHRLGIVVLWLMVVGFQGIAPGAEPSKRETVDAQGSPADSNREKSVSGQPSKKADAISPKSNPSISGGYAVVVSEKTLADPSWKKVVKALQAKYPAARVIRYKKSVSESQKKLAELMPRYTCFVGKPEEVGRSFVVEVHRLTRQLNDDPFTDTLWGILTGFDAQNALDIAKIREPLVIRKGVGLGMNLGPFDEAVDLSDSTIGVTRTKTADGQIKTENVGEEDRSETFRKSILELKPDFMGSDGHATERDLQMPWGKGAMICKEGKLAAVNTKEKKATLFESPNPKVYLAYGNCLIGHVDDQNALALALMKSGGVKQMIGYTVVTWYGKMGWGAADWFWGQPGRFSLAESFFISHQVLLHDLRTRFPKSADFNIDLEDYGDHGTHLDRIVQKLGNRSGGDPSQKKDELGMLWDRDTVAFWGDPAWDARFPTRESDWEQTLTRQGNRFTFTLVPKKDREIGGVFAFLPSRVKNVKLIEGQSLQPVVGCHFLMIPKVGKVEKNKSITISFEAESF